MHMTRTVEFKSECLLRGKLILIATIVSIINLVPQASLAACVLTCIRGTDRPDDAGSRECYYFEGLPLLTRLQESPPNMCSRLLRERQHSPDISCHNNWAPGQTCQQLGLPDMLPPD
jgi:hypothetical protein